MLQPIAKITIIKPSDDLHWATLQPVQLKTDGINVYAPVSPYDDPRRTKAFWYMTWTSEPLDAHLWRYLCPHNSFILEPALWFSAYLADPDPDGIRAMDVQPENPTVSG